MEPRIPPKGTIARDMAELSVRWRQALRALYAGLPFKDRVPWPVVVPGAGRVLYRWGVFWGSVYMVVVIAILIWRSLSA